MAGGVKPGNLTWFLLAGLCLLAVASLTWRVMSSGEHRRPEQRVVVVPPDDPGPPRSALPWRSPSSDADSDSLPAYGRFVHVDELPEAITKVAPEYPDVAKRNNLEGNVIVQALIGRDGRVVDARVVSPAPPFDNPALAAVREWTFRPARAGGRPVALWVTVPVKFTLR